VEYAAALAGLALVHFLAAASPGPSTVLVIQTAASSGRRAAFFMTLAMTVGAVAWAAAALYGLQALFARFEWLYIAMRIAGGIYLIYLAVMLWLHAGKAMPEFDESKVGGKEEQRSDWQAFTKALTLQVSNPKVIVFFGSIFISLLPAQPPGWMEATVLAVVAFNEFTWYALISLLFSGETARSFYRRAKLWTDRLMGSVLGLLGLRLALMDR
jgi:threonine/homoserine/homoserine lactone efflux protein